MTDTISMPILPVLPGIALTSTQKTIPFPTNKTLPQSVKKSIPKPQIPLPKTQVEVIVLQTVSIENELRDLGYLIISKIVTQKLQFLKATNKKGQKVYIYVDVPEYSSIDVYDIMLLENGINSLSYSIKNGVYDCVGTDVSGIVFEYGTNLICTIMRGDNDLKINEMNYTFGSQFHNLSFEGCVITYPIIKLSELRVNPDIILCNTDIVTRRLRNTEDSHERKELTNTDYALEQLDRSLCNFKEVCNHSTHKLISSINHLKTLQEQEYNEELRNDLVKSNDNIVKLICVMKKVASKRVEMERMTCEIDELTNYLESHF
jgi:hypothetical protein